LEERRRGTVTSTRTRARTKGIRITEDVDQDEGYGLVRRYS